MYQTIEIPGPSKRPFFPSQPLELPGFVIKHLKISLVYTGMDVCFIFSESEIYTLEL